LSSAVCKGRQVNPDSNREKVNHKPFRFWILDF
jgi:hypothetical protein